MARKRKRAKRKPKVKSLLRFDPKRDLQGLAKNLQKVNKIGIADRTRIRSVNDIVKSRKSLHELV